MHLLRDDLAWAAVQSVRAGTEWPQYSIFLAIQAYDTLVIAPPGYTHGDLFLLLRDEWRRSNSADPVLGHDDVIDGHIEWEDDGSFQARTQRGESLPVEIDQLIATVLNQRMGENP